MGLFTLYVPVFKKIERFVFWKYKIVFTDMRDVYNMSYEKCWYKIIYRAQSHFY